MIPQFEGLSEHESNLMYDAIPLITLLIAGADGKIEEDETEWAKKITKIRTYASHDTLQPFYEALNKTYNDKLDYYIKALPLGTDVRTKEISKILGGLNDILPKLDNNFAARYYKDLISFAEHVAKSAGGFLGIGSISYEEKQVMGLEMINPIQLEEGEENQEDA